ncbi:unnamed protein product, partial [Iphiclides podalirius]
MTRLGSCQGIGFGASGRGKSRGPATDGSGRPWRGELKPPAPAFAASARHAAQTQCQSVCSRRRCCAVVFLVTRWKCALSG